MSPDAAPSPSLPLRGVRVLDLSRVLAGPWCTQTLADLGADVIKVERPPGPGSSGGDDTRGWGPPFLKDSAGHDTAEAAYYLGANRNKRSITVDIARPEGQALIRRIALQSDVFVENYKVGDMARYGLDATSLLALNPRLVYCSVTGFGQTGPYRERAGYDYAVQGMGGLMSVTGPSRAEIADDASGGGPQKVGVAVADLFTGMYATTAILAALRHRDLTGEGQSIDMALLDTQVAMLANLGANYLTSGAVPQRMGNAHQNIVPYQVFEVADGHMIVAVGNDGQFAKFCEVAGQPDLSRDPRFARNADRVRHRAALVPVLAALMKTRSRVDWLAALEAAKVPCGPINDLADVLLTRIRA
jgi:crotonobetainyl-CoA:carnitine CoA-transferase CaiB-like acyl-CoA transferase